MRKIMVFLTAMTFVAFTYMNPSVFAASTTDPMGKTYEDLSPWIAKGVWNIQGSYLGTVKSFVRDPDGKVSFAIVSHRYFLGLRERKVAIPYSALTFDHEKQHFTCPISWDRFITAPVFETEEKLHDRSFAEEIYRYFGQQPYWTEESTEMSE